MYRVRLVPIFDSIVLVLILVLGLAQDCIAMKLATCFINLETSHFISGLRGTDALVTTTARVIAMVVSVDLSGFAPSEISNSMTEENINRILKAREIKISNKEENIKNILWASVGLHTLRNQQQHDIARYWGPQKSKLKSTKEITILNYH